MRSILSASGSRQTTARMAAAVAVRSCRISARTTASWQSQTSRNPALYSVGSCTFTTAAGRRQKHADPHSLAGINTHLPPAVRVRNILHSTSQLFSPDSALESRAWRIRAESAAERLAQQNGARTLRIGVVGDTLSGIRGLTNALLDDPLVEYAQKKEAAATLPALEQWKSRLRDKKEDLRADELQHDTVTLVRFGEKESVSVQGQATLIVAPYLWLCDHNVQLIELLNPRYSSATISKLFDCDRLLFVTDDLTLAAHQRFGSDLHLGDDLRLLRYFAQKPGTSVAVNQTGRQLPGGETMLEQGLQQAISSDAYSALTTRRRPGKGGQNGGIFHTSIQSALKANEALRSALAVSDKTEERPRAAWDAFSSLTVASGLVKVRAAIEGASRSTSSNTSISMTSSDALEKSALQTSTFVLRRALDQALFSIQADLNRATQAQGAAEVLRQEVGMERARVFSDVFDVATRRATEERTEKQRHSSTAEAFHRRTGDRSRSVDAASKDAWGVVEAAFSARLPWWKVLWKVDDVRAETEAAVERGFARDLEQRLMVQTGRLVSVAERLQQRVRTLFNELETGPAAAAKSTRRDNADDDGDVTRNPFASPVLLNELRKYSLDVVEANLRQDDVLTQPIEQRRQQFLAEGGPMDVLCRRAQQSTLTTLSVIGTTGVACLTSGLAGSSFGAGMPAALQAMALQPSTAAALFGFVSIAAAWVMQSRWTRAKRRFWRDWERITDGLDDDLQRNLSNTFDGIVAAQSLVAANGLQRQTSRYVQELDEAQEAVQAILNQLRPSKAVGNRKQAI